MVSTELDKTVDDRIDELEVLILSSMHLIDCPLVHRFTDTTYVREIFMAKNSLVISKIHLTEHPFFILKGKATVFCEQDGVVTLEAPYIGITKPGTRRVLYIHEDCIWATTHTLSNPQETLEEIEDRIIKKHTNEFLEEAKAFIRDSLKISNDEN